jgi:tRNA threonylcarbamoyladenosine biosynthesis protein TsaE
MFNFVSHNENETKKIASLLASKLQQGDIVVLSGDLGSGKTKFTEGFLGYWNLDDEISSPTFNILKCYFKAKIPLYHIDAYRLEDGTNKDIGLEEFIDGDGLCVIEWPNFIDYLIPNLYLSINIEHVDGDIRKFKISSKDERWNSLIDSLKEEFLCTESF